MVFVDFYFFCDYMWFEDFNIYMRFKVEDKLGNSMESFDEEDDDDDEEF